MKKCCLTRGHITCGDCEEYESCESIQSFLNHPGYKYGKYRRRWSTSAAMATPPPESGRALDKRLW